MGTNHSHDLFPNPKAQGSNPSVHSNTLEFTPHSFSNPNPSTTARWWFQEGQLLK